MLTVVKIQWSYSDSDEDPRAVTLTVTDTPHRKADSDGNLTKWCWQWEPWKCKVSACLLFMCCMFILCMYYVCLFAYCVSWLSSNGMLLRPPFLLFLPLDLPCFFHVHVSLFPTTPTPSPFSVSILQVWPLLWLVLLAERWLTVWLSFWVPWCLSALLAVPELPPHAPCWGSCPARWVKAQALVHRAQEVPGNPSVPSSEGTNENDSEDSETFWPYNNTILPSYL